MTLATAIQTPLECPSEAPAIVNRQSTIDNPSIVLPGGVKVFTKRDGDHVTGRVDFPYEVSGRTSVPIDYFNVPPLPAGEGRGEGCLAASLPPCLDAKALARKAMVLKWRSLCDSDETLTRKQHARAVCEAAIGFKCSTRSLQLWARKLDTEGESGLCDRYEPAPRKVLSLDAALAKDAISICAWWAFRIGNEPVMDSKMVHSAALLRPRAEYMRDILAAIDVYYAWPTDRQIYRFKSFARWAKYEFEKYLFRALEVSDPKRVRAVPRAVVSEPRPEGSGPGCSTPALGCGDALGCAHVERPAGGPPLTVIPMDSAPNAKTRKREGNCFATRRALAAMPGSEPGAQATGPSAPTVSGLQPAACLFALDDRYRWLLIRAARGDTDAINQAVVTMPIWWDKLPEALRHNIDARAAAWKRDHPQATNYVVAARKLAMLGPAIRRPQKGPVSGCELLELAV